jgi:4-hydroxythreonine-4-phosphate dehydrogenase
MEGRKMRELWETERPIVAITMGDAAGIGPEIAVRVLCDVGTYRLCRPLIVGDASVIQAVLDGMRLNFAVHPIATVGQARFEPRYLDVLDLHNIDMGQLKKGMVDPMAGAAAYQYIITAADLAMQGEVDAVVTCPICKEALNLAGYEYPGHTEIFAERTGAREYAMMMSAGALRVVIISTHLPLRAALDLISQERILTAVRLADELGRLLGMGVPRIAVPGLNPHASEGGIFGSEELEIIIPAIRQAQAMGFQVSGPFPADMVFYRAVQGEFDFVIALYHDQGLIPIKLLGFGAGVNVTLGLPIVRTSVDHGTAFDIAWQFRASACSLTEAIRWAVQLSKARQRARAGRMPAQ